MTLEALIERAFADLYTPSEKCPGCWNSVGSLDCRCQKETVLAPVIELKAVS